MRPILTIPHHSGLGCKWITILILAENALASRIKKESPTSSCCIGTQSLRVCIPTQESVGMREKIDRGKYKAALIRGKDRLDPYYRNFELISITEFLPARK